MAKRNPNSPEWLARCVDAAAAFTDGRNMKNEAARRPAWDLYLTLPPYFGMGGRGAEWARSAAGLLETCGFKNVLGGPEGCGASHRHGGRRQFYLTGPADCSGEDVFVSFENALLSLYDRPEMDEMTAGAAAAWKDALASARPSGSVPQGAAPEGILRKLHDALPAGYSGPLAERCLDVALLFKEGKKAEAEKELYILCQQAAQDGDGENRQGKAAEAFKTAFEELNEYRSGMRVKEEKWLAQALTPLALPFAILFIKPGKDGKLPIFDTKRDFSEALLKRTFSDDFPKIKAQAEATSVLSAKIFPISGYRAGQAAPSVEQRDCEIRVYLNWQHFRLNYPTAEAFVKHLQAEYGAEVADSRAATARASKYPDPYGYETMNSRRAVIKFDSREKAAEAAKTIGGTVKLLFSPRQEAPAAEPGLTAEQAAKKIAESADLIEQRIAGRKAEREASLAAMKIADRVTPYPAKCAVFAQVRGYMTPEIEKALAETLKEFPEWHEGAVKESRSYTSIHLNGSYTGEGAGFAERMAVAKKLAGELTKATGRQFNAEYPDGGFKVEVTVRKMNTTENFQAEDTYGIYVKVPLAAAPGGRIEGEVIDDPEALDKLDGLSQGLFALGESFGRNSGSKGMMRSFVQKNSPLEAYTATWAYKIKETDDREAKLAELKKILEEKINDAFGEEYRDKITIDWLPDKDARKLELCNRQIQGFAFEWGELPEQKGSPAPAPEEEYAPAL